MSLALGSLKGPASTVGIQRVANRGNSAENILEHTSLYTCANLLNWTLKQSKDTQEPFPT